MKHQVNQPIRVLVVEDSRAQLELLVGLLRSSPEFELVGTASNGQQAISMALQLRPDVIAMDIHLPALDGYEATRQIMQRCPTPIVMMSSHAGNEQRRSVEALAAGALTVVRKPARLMRDEERNGQTSFLTTLRLMAKVQVVTRFPPRQPVSAPLAHVVRPERSAAIARPRVLAIAASTGGPAALQTLLRALDDQFPLPILVAQHIARGFVPALADWLNSTVRLPVGIVKQDEPLVPAHVYLAPENYHLMVREPGIAFLRPFADGERFCPSGDLLFESVAESYGAGAIGLVMTGMGDDGTRGLLALRSVGGQTLAQDETSSVVYGMPRAAVEAGAVERVAALAALADVIMHMVH